MSNSQVAPAADYDAAQCDASNARAIVWAHGVVAAASDLGRADYNEANNLDAFTRLCVHALACMVERGEERAARAAGHDAPNATGSVDSTARDLASGTRSTLDGAA